MSDSMPVFVKVDEYRDILDVIGLIKDKVEDAKTNLDRINQLKSEEDMEVDAWRESLADMERRLHFIDQILFEPKF